MFERVISFFVKMKKEIMEEIMFEIKIKYPKKFNIDCTLDCGQTFRWKKSGNVWKGVVKDTALILEDENGCLKVNSSKNSLFGMGLNEGLRYYFGFDDDLDKIHEFIRDMSENFSERTRKISLKALKDGEGIRILRQDPFEMTVDYIISSRNSIINIRNTADRISSFFEQNRVILNGEEFYKFPTYDQFKSLTEKNFRDLRTAFRAKYLAKLSETVKTEAFFKKLYAMNEIDIIEELIKIKGIGYKVASCIALFGYGKLNCFPVDIWIIRAMEDLFDIKGNTTKIMERGMEMFSPYAGYFQEVLFRYYRLNYVKEIKK
jgi:N-glycosylase/DNA lyase